MVAPVTCRVYPLELVVAELCVAAVDFEGDLDSAFSAFFEEDEEAEDSAFVVLVLAFLPIESFRPGWISDGSSPMAARLSAYSFFQPPLTFCSSAILER